MAKHRAVTDVEINGQSAATVLDNLKVKADSYRKAMTEANKANDKLSFDKAEAELKKTEKAMHALEKATFNVNEIAKNLSGATLKDLTRAKRQLQAELAKTTRGTDEWIKKSKQLGQINGEIKKVRTEMNGVSGAQSNLFGKLQGSLTAFMGVAAGAWGVVRAGASIMKSAQQASDAWEISITGLKWGFDALKKNIATMNFGTLITDMQRAAAAGREYAKIMDDLGDKERAYKVLVSELRIEIERLERVRDNVNLGNQARMEAAQKINELEREQFELNQGLKEKYFEAEMKRIKRFTGLSEEQIKTFIKQYIEQEELRKSAEKYLAAQELVNKSTSTGSKFLSLITGNTVDFSMSMSMSAEQLAELKRLIASTPEDAKEYAKTLKAVGAVTDIELDKLTKAWEDLNGAELSSLQLTQRNEAKLNALKKSFSDEREKNNERELNNQLAALDKQHVQLLYEIDRAYLEEHQNKQLHQKQIEAAEIAHLQAMIAMRKHYGLESLTQERQLMKMRIALLEEFRNEEKMFSDSLIQENFKVTQDYLDAEFKAIEDQAKELAKLDADALERKKQLAEQQTNITRDMAMAMGTLLGQAAMDAEMTAQQLAKELILVALDALEAFVNITLAEIWTKAIANPAQIPIAVAQTVAIKILFAGARAAVGKIGQRFKGKYDVIGEDDGKLYRNVPYKGQMKTGIYGTPTLVAERGDELVVDAATLKNIQVNFPDVLPKVRAAMVPQKASGNVGQIQFGQKDAMLATLNPGMLAITVKDLVSVVNQLSSVLKGGINAKISYSHLENETNKVEKIKRDSSR
jgi:hypothetical protein